ncbi:LysR family transcriptional regulator [Vibrio sp. Vb339]|uniref:LysR family transcriptional regulator n=1 Tax=Vibrio sp. Vb339 TaxID=1192013 RepID=UPI00155649C2|nr:LysR family transcriptional regulator [Vibrio sp. Vb339]
MDPLNDIYKNNNVHSRYNILSLALFITVSETGSIAATASRHNIAASAVSRRISELEALIDTTLLYRQQRGVELTSAGQEFYRHSQNVLMCIQKMEKSMEEFSNGIRGSIRIAANTSSITQFLPDDLAIFTRD